MQPSSPSGTPSPTPELAEQPPTPAPPKKGSRRTLLAVGIGVIVIIVVIAASVVYLGLLNPSTAGGTIKLGFTISLTGTYNVEGTNSLRGIQTAVSWINAHGGITVQGKVYNLSIDYVDDQSVTSNIVSLYTRIVTQDNAQFLLAPYSSGLTSAAAPIADQYDRVMLSHGGAADTIWNTGSGYRNLVEVLSPASGYLKSAVDWLHANHPTDKIAALYASDSFSSLAASSAVAYAQSLGLNVVYNQSYPTSVTDLTPQLTNAKNAGADDIIGGGHYTDGLLIANGLTSVSWTPKFISLLVAVTEQAFQTQLGAVANNITGPSQWETTVTYGPSLAASRGVEWYGPTPAQFTSLYENLSPTATPSYHSGEAGAAVFDLVDAIQKADSLNTTAVRAALGSLHLMTFFGEFQVNSRGLQIAHTMVLDQWQAGKLQVVYPAAVAEAPVQYPYTGS